MSFTLRQITRRAGGGEIARTAALVGAEIVVGRGTDCDVQIPDLAVMLRHARLIQLGTGRIALDAIGGVPLNVDGRFVDRTEAAVADEPALRLGSHLLTVSAGDNPGEIVVTVERVVAAFDQSAMHDEAKIFGLAGVLPGKRGLAWALALLVLGVALAWPVWLTLRPAPASAVTAPSAVQTAGFRPDQLWTSGPLSRAHANLSNNCGACHDQAFVSVRDTSCRVCHANLSDHAPLTRMQAARTAPTGIVAISEAKLAAAAHLTVGRCAACHKEHEGPDGALMVASSFCGDCHAGLSRRLPNAKLLDVTGFAGPGAHPQFRPTIVVRPSDLTPAVQRVSLDAKPRENSGLKFPHRLHLARTGSVARLSPTGPLTCAGCHAPDADRQRFQAVTMENNCAGCHDLAFDRDRSGIVRTLPHGRPEQVAGILRDFYTVQPGWAGFGDRRRPGLVSPVQSARGIDAKIRAVFSPGGACFDCHAVVAPARGLNFAITPVSVTDHYLPKGRFPHGKHDATPCATCHAGAVVSERSSDVLLPGIATCRTCHGNAKATTLVPSTCQTCHDYHPEPKPVAAAGQRGQKAPPPGLPPPLPPPVGSQGTPSIFDGTTGNSVNTGS